MLGGPAGGGLGGAQGKLRDKIVLEAQKAPSVPLEKEGLFWRKGRGKKKKREEFSGKLKTKTGEGPEASGSSPVNGKRVPRSSPPLWTPLWEADYERGRDFKEAGLLGGARFWGEPCLLGKEAWLSKIVATSTPAASRTYSSSSRRS
jgi:hypothetical protein